VRLPDAPQAVAPLILALIPRLLLILIGGAVAAMLAQLAEPAVRKLPRAEPLPSPS
jgi:hypothetical protein